MNQTPILHQKGGSAEIDPFWMPFKPHVLIPGPVAQTIWGSQFTGDTRIPPRTFHKIRLEENAVLVLAELKPQTPGRPLVLLAHGMGGCSESAYIRRIANKLSEEGYGVFMMNHRGSGPGMGLCDRLFNGGSSGDLKAVLQFIANRYPDSPLLAMGFSLSGNILLKYLGEGRESIPQLRAAFAVNPPIDLKVASRAISHGAFARTFNRYYLGLMYNQLDALRECFPSAFAPTQRARTIWEFDQLYTAPAAGYATVEDYYDACSARQFLNGIRIPTTVLCSQDDPFIPPSVFDGIESASNVRFVNPKAGGHMGYIARKLTPFGDRRWMDYVCVEWVRAHTPKAERWGK
ncbi:YheT family hydrolase [Nitrospina gracilis]|uniref:YheT family hydrolase n=1 Tax=Nitrospina gracilis TaxID=35801 RepID=UPI001F18C10D|nr:putative alpha/beta-fold hydrolase [Nitrospina gracilis Nb-211]